MSNTETAFGVGGILVVLLVAAIGIGFFAFWLWMLIHSITNKGLSDTEKVLWVLLVLFLPLLGPILYFFIGRPKTSVAGP